MILTSKIVRSLDVAKHTHMYTSMYFYIFKHFLGVNFTNIHVKYGSGPSISSRVHVE
jgi:hypothetical protein